MDKIRRAIAYALIGISPVQLQEEFRLQAEQIHLDLLVKLTEIDPEILACKKATLKISYYSMCEFYKAFGRFPDIGLAKIINHFGVHTVIDGLRTNNNFKINNN